MSLNLAGRWKKVSPENGYSANYDHFRRLESSLEFHLGKPGKPSLNAAKQADIAFQRTILVVARGRTVNMDVVFRLYEIASKYGPKLPCFLDFSNEVQEMFREILISNDRKQPQRIS